MKLPLLLIIFLVMMSAACSDSASTSAEYDPNLAAQLGADDYGMKNYILVILKTGPAVIEEKSLRDSLFAGHFSNMGAMSEQGKLIVAGPLGTNPLSYRGIFILNTTSMEEARELLENDPTISHQIFEAELIPWYGSAALSEYLKVHERIQKEKI